MTEISFMAGVLAVIVLWILFRGAAFCRNKKADLRFEALQMIFLINLIVIVRFTFYPFDTVDGQILPLLFDPETVWPFRLNLVPFVKMTDHDTNFDILLNIIGNFAMFIPTGIITPLIYKNLRTLKKTLLTGLLLSLCIELVQLPFAVRATDVDDLILNTAGCLAGYGIYALAGKIKRRIAR